MIWPELVVPVGLLAVQYNSYVVDGNRFLITFVSDAFKISSRVKLSEGTARHLKIYLSPAPPKVPAWIGCLMLTATELIVTVEDWTDTLGADGLKPEFYDQTITQRRTSIPSLITSMITLLITSLMTSLIATLLTSLITSSITSRWLSSYRCVFSCPVSPLSTSLRRLTRRLTSCELPFLNTFCQISGQCEFIRTKFI